MALRKRGTSSESTSSTNSSSSSSSSNSDSSSLSSSGNRTTGSESKGKVLRKTVTDTSSRVKTEDKDKRLKISKHRLFSDSESEQKNKKPELKTRRCIYTDSESEDKSRLDSKLIKSEKISPARNSEEKFHIKTEDEIKKEKDKRYIYETNTDQKPIVVKIEGSKKLDSKGTKSGIYTDSEPEEKPRIKVEDDNKKSDSKRTKRNIYTDSEPEEKIIKCEQKPKLVESKRSTGSETEDKKILSKSSRKTSMTGSVTKLIQQKNQQASTKKFSAPKIETKSSKKEGLKSSDVKDKKKSIFSPRRSITPSPPKLTPMNVVPTRRVSRIASKPDITSHRASSTSGRSRSSSLSSTSSDSSSMSGHSSRKPSSKISTKVKQPMSNSFNSQSVVKKTGRGRGRPRKYENAVENNSNYVKKPLTVDNNKIITRKQSQSKISTITRVSKLFNSRGSNSTDSDSSTGDRYSGALAMPLDKRDKMFGSKRDRYGKNMLPDSSQPSLVELQERSCPVEGCNSLGHMNGIYEKHFTTEACPLFHNMTFKQCQENLSDRLERDELKRKVLKSLDYASYVEKVNELKNKEYPSSTTPDDPSDNMSINNNNSENSSSSCSNSVNTEREPDLGKCNVSPFELKLFREAQAIASEKIEEDLKLLPNVRGIKYIELGKHEIEVWYQSPYPEEYTQVPKLYLCEFCLKYMKSKTIFKRHMLKCVWRHPPGDEAYRKDHISVWEVDGKKCKTYSQHLCLLAKFFLDHKTLYYDVEPFLFYIMTVNDGEGCHIVGYFSKEKNSFLNFNVSCILTLPPYQRQGYGRLLIEFSYLLTRVEGKVGSPEKPLSDLGLISYRSFWKDVVLERLCNLEGKQISVKDMSTELAINAYDIVSTLQVLGMIKYWKGKHIILKKQELIDEYLEKKARRSPHTHKEIDPRCLRWSPPSLPNLHGIGNVS